MSYESRIEDMIYDIKDYVTDNYNTYLQGIADNKNDGIPLPVMKDTVIGDANPYTWNKFPVMMINPSRMDAEIISSGYDQISIELAFIIVITGGKASNLTIQALRYAEALRQLFLADPTCGDAVDVMGDAVNVEYFPGVSGEDEKKVTIFTATFIKEVAR